MSGRLTNVWTCNNRIINAMLGTNVSWHYKRDIEKCLLRITFTMEKNLKPSKLLEVARANNWVYICLHFFLYSLLFWPETLTSFHPHFTRVLLLPASSSAFKSSFQKVWDNFPRQSFLIWNNCEISIACRSSTVWQMGRLSKGRQVREPRERSIKSVAWDSLK